MIPIRAAGRQNHVLWGSYGPSQRVLMVSKTPAAVLVADPLMSVMDIWLLIPGGVAEIISPIPGSPARSIVAHMKPHRHRIR